MEESKNGFEWSKKGQEYMFTDIQRGPKMASDNAKMVRMIF